MIVCRASEPKDVPGWRRVLDLDQCTLPSADEFTIEEPDWNENVIERTLLRRPDVLACTVGLRASPDGLLALRQVARVDLYLRGGTDLHLLEMKRPRAYGQWLFAVEQIVRQWCAAATWLRRSGESVHLWAVVPVRWSAHSGKPKIPSNWSTSCPASREEALLAPPSPKSESSSTWSSDLQPGASWSSGAWTSRRRPSTGGDPPWQHQGRRLRLASRLATRPTPMLRGATH